MGSFPPCRDAHAVNYSTDRLETVINGEEYLESFSILIQSTLPQEVGTLIPALSFVFIETLLSTSALV